MVSHLVDVRRLQCTYRPISHSHSHRWCQVRNLPAYLFPRVADVYSNNAALSVT